MYPIVYKWMRVRVNSATAIATHIVSGLNSANLRMPLQPNTVRYFAPRQINPHWNMIR